VWKVSLGYPSASEVGTVTDTPTLTVELKGMLAALRDPPHSKSMLQMKDLNHEEYKGEKGNKPSRNNNAGRRGKNPIMTFVKLKSHHRMVPMAALRQKFGLEMAIMF
jgi:hypothetical protein